MKPRHCKDCDAEGVTTKRPAPHPGPRCTTHHRAVKKQRKAKAHARRIDTFYGITTEQYQMLYQYQGGRCAICQWATGATRNLAVDHDHSCTKGHPPERGCQHCVRGLLCSVCNRVVIGRYTPEGLQRAIDYLNDPPARRVLKRRR